MSNFFLYIIVNLHKKIIEKYDKEKREYKKIPEKDDTSSSTQRENSKQNEPKDSDSDSDFDMMMRC